MNPLRDMIINEIVRPEIKASSKVHVGIIESCNTKNKTANVRLGIASDEQYKNVPFDRGASFVYGSNPKSGTPVIVSFVGGDMNYPYIISILSDKEDTSNTGKTRMIPEVSTTAVSASGTVHGGMGGAF